MAVEKVIFVFFVVVFVFFVVSLFDGDGDVGGGPAALIAAAALA